MNDIKRLGEPGDQVGVPIAVLAEEQADLDEAKSELAKLSSGEGETSLSFLLCGNADHPHPVAAIPSCMSKKDV